ncbi:MAG: Bax inhibitor-1/YccA family protein [Planctomycetota bacterium]
MFSTGNPAIAQAESAFGSGDWAEHTAAPKVMTYTGTIINSGILLTLTAGTAAALWATAADGWAFPLAIGGAIIGLILALVIIFNPKTSPFLAPVYAIVEGAFVAGLSVFWAGYAASKQAASTQAGGVVSQLDTSLVAQAAGLTFSIAAVMLAAYALRIIRATPLVVKMIVFATGGVVLFALASILLSFMGIRLYEFGGPIHIGIAGVVVVVAAFNLVIDFKIIEDGVAAKAPKYMEWYAGFALLVTIVWLYVSLLRLLALLRGSE